jgi:hypothetical protein
MTINHTKWQQNIPKGSKNVPNGRKMYQHIPFQDLPKLTLMWIFGLKIYHLATLNGM